MLTWLEHLLAHIVAAHGAGDDQLLEDLLVR